MAYRCLCVPVCRCTCVLVHWCNRENNVPVYQCASVPVCRCIGVWVYRYTSVVLHPCSCVATFLAECKAGSKPPNMVSHSYDFFFKKTWECEADMPSLPQAVTFNSRCTSVPVHRCTCAPVLHLHLHPSRRGLENAVNKITQNVNAIFRLKMMVSNASLPANQPVALHIPT